MTTLRTPRLADFSPEDRAILERTAKRMGRTAEALLEPSIMGVQTHWPAGSQPPILRRVGASNTCRGRAGLRLQARRRDADTRKRAC